MNMNTVNKKIARLAMISFSFMTLVGFSAPSALASVEDIKGFKNQVLDGIEEFVINTGLVDAKKKLWEEYNFLIKPFFKTRYDLTSNVFSAPDTDSDHTDSIFSFTPGVQFVYKNKYGVIGGAYEATFKYFTQFNEQNTQDQSFLVYANLFPTDNMYVRVSEKLDQKGSTAGSSAFEPVNYKDNRVSVVTGYRSGDLTFEFGYENFDRDFQETIAKVHSYDEDKFDYRTYYQWSEQIKVYTGIRIGNVDFGKNPIRDTLYWEIPVGFEAVLPTGINARASVGVHHRNVEADGRNDITHVVTNISLQKNFNAKRTSVELGFLRRPVESSFATAGIYDEKLWYGAVKHLITPTLRGRSNIYVGNRDFEDRIFTGPRVIVAGVPLVVGGSQVKRDDNIFGFGLGFDYNVRKWLILHIDYLYSRRDSNISSLDYTENVFSLGSTIPL